MTQRHYGLTEPPAKNPTSSGAWNSSAFIGGTVAMMIVLGIVLYGISKTVTDAANTTASAPRTTGKGNAR